MIPIDRAFGSLADLVSTVVNALFDDVRIDVTRPASRARVLAVGARA